MTSASGAEVRGVLMERTVQRSFSFSFSFIFSLRWQRLHAEVELERECAERGTCWILND